MSLALRWGEDDEEEGGMVWFDATTLYTQNYKGQVTKHPVDTGGNITDHFIRDNPVFTVSAVIVGIDISTNSYLIEDLVGRTPYNTRQAPDAVSVNSTDDSMLKQFLPDSIGQFLPEPNPDIVVNARRTNPMDTVRQALIDLISGVKFNEETGQFDNKIQVVRLFEYGGVLLKRVINNLVITNITFREDANTGYGLYCDFTFEQVTFATLKKTTIPQNVQQSLLKKASSKNSKGKVDSTPQPAANNTAVNNAATDIDPRRPGQN